MIRIIIALLVVCAMCGPSWADNKFWWATGLTGGGYSLDGIDGNRLNDGDAATVVKKNGSDYESYTYYLNATSGATEASPTVIKPDSNAGTKRWHLASSWGYAAPFKINSGELRLYEGDFYFDNETSDRGIYFNSTSYPMGIVADSYDGIGINWGTSSVSSTDRIQIKGTDVWIARYEPYYLSLGGKTGVRIVNGVDRMPASRGGYGTDSDNYEDIEFQRDASNVMSLGTSTGTTLLRMTQGLMLAPNMNVVAKTGGATLAVAEMNGIVFTTGAGTYVLPEIVASSPTSSQVMIGAHACFVNRDDNEVIVIDPNNNDSITLDGTKDTAGHSIRNAVTASTGGGDYICLFAAEADNWMAMMKSGTWSAD